MVAIAREPRRRGSGDQRLLGQAATRLSAPREALDLVSVHLDRPDRNTPPPRIRWVRPRHYD